MTRQNNQHRRALEKIAAHPEKFGFDNVASLAIELNLYNGRNLTAQPDIVMEILKNSKREIHIIEYKGNGDEELLERARRQLVAAAWWFGKYRSDIDPKNIYTYIISGTDPKYKGLFR